MLSNKHLIAVCGTVLCFNLTALVFLAKHLIKEQCIINLEEQTVSITLPEDYLSFGIDTSEIQDEGKLDFKNSRFRELAAFLAPARLRVGGTMSDRLVFSKETTHATCKHCPVGKVSKSVCTAIKKMCKHKFLPFFLLTGDKWKDINEFCKDTRIKLLFSFNVLLRDHNEWSQLNALELLEFTKQNMYEVDWQLGNEPNSFKHVFNISLPPQVLAHDFKKLRNLLNTHGFDQSLLVGPDTTRPQQLRPECLKYMEEFLGNGSEFINVRSWHQYYLNSATASLDDFWNPDTFDLLEEQIIKMKEHTKKYSYIPLWLSETGSSYGGGAPDLSNSFAGSPLWVDKLGLSAKYNITTVIRQSFYGGNYSMVDSELNPLPDWWISVLYKKLVGNKVLHIKCQCSKFQRMYAHCVNRSYSKDKTAITIYAVNLEMVKVRFILNGTAFESDNLQIDEFIVRAPLNNRRSKTILLNGRPLYYDSILSGLQPQLIKYSNSISMPPYSIGFWVVKNTKLNICT